MFRLFRAELKKIFLKPSIFIVTGLIIFMLAASIFLYNPRTKDEEYVKYNEPGLVTVNDYYNYFNYNGSYYQAKINIDNLLVKSQAYLDFYSSNTDVVNALKSQWDGVRELYNQRSQYGYLYLYDQWILSNKEDDTIKTDLINKRNDLKNAIDNFSATYAGYLQREEISFLVTSEDSATLYSNHLLTMKNYFIQAEENVDNVDDYIVNNLKSSNLFEIVAKDLDKLLPFAPSADVVNDLYEYIILAKERNTALLVEINDFEEQYQSSTSDIDVKAFLKLVTDYYLNANYSYNIIVDAVKISGLSNYTALDITKFKKFENTNIYEMQEKNTRYTYLFKNETYQYNYADPFSIVQPSNTKINGFDYSYFALRLCTFFITIYIVVLAAGTIAGEQSSGTLKLLAIRPYGRNKLLSAKILATITIGAILIFVSGVASLVVGGVTYGMNSLPILAVFNAKYAFSISPILLYLIAVVTMFIEVLFYAMISVFISTVFKSNVAAVSISTLLFFVSLILNVIANSKPIVGLIPFINTNLFKYFGSSFISNAVKPGLLQSILTPSVFAGSTFFLSAGIYVVFFAIITVATHLVFKKRDIK